MYFSHGVGCFPSHPSTLAFSPLSTLTNSNFPLNSKSELEYVLTWEGITMAGGVLLSTARRNATQHSHTQISNKKGHWRKQVNLRMYTTSTTSKCTHMTSSTRARGGRRRRRNEQEIVTAATAADQRIATARCCVCTLCLTQKRQRQETRTNRSVVSWRLYATPLPSSSSSSSSSSSTSVSSPASASESGGSLMSRADVNKHVIEAGAKGRWKVVFGIFMSFVLWYDARPHTYTCTASW